MSAETFHYTLLLITDGRWRYFEATLNSFLDQTEDVFDHWLVVDDSLDPRYRSAINATFKFDQHITNDGQKRGFGGAIQAGWEALPPETDFVFHLEDDFTFNRPLDIRAMATVLDANPHLAQMALRRQPWNDVERAAGGIIECFPHEYAERQWREWDWLEHRLFFTTNPSLYPRRTAERGWPVVPGSERKFSERLFEDPQVRCGYWGQRSEGPRVHHIGHEQVGIDY